MGNAGQHGRVGNLVPVEMQDRQHRAVGHGIEELVGMPRRRQRPGLGLAVADDTRHDQIGIIKHRAERMADGITQLTALVNGPGRFGRSVTGNAAGKRELDKKFSQPCFILADVGINLAVGPFEVSISHDRRTAVPRTGHVDHVEVVLLDDAVEVRVDEILPRRRAPMSEQHVLHVAERERALEQRIVVKIDLPDRKIVGRAPVSVDPVKQFRRQGVGFRCHVLRCLHQPTLRRGVSDARGSAASAG